MAFEKNEKHINDGRRENFSMAGRYTKLDHREHVLKRPQMYIGSVVPDQYHTWLWKADEKRMVQSEIELVPGLYKIFDEILVNAIDHCTRLKGVADGPRVKNIRVKIDVDTGYIEVFNDGTGIEVEKHPEHGIYIPELIFGNLLTSVNYDDEEQRVIGGQNGIGAKACNIFSKHFVVDTVDSNTRKSYVQEFKDNMTVVCAPTIRACAKKPYTRIRFLPDYARFGCNGISAEMQQLMTKRVYDICALTDPTVSVYLNDTKLEIKSMEKYMDMFLDDKTVCPRVHEKIDERWEVGVAMGCGTFKQVSFVNGIWTLKGGKHVDYMTNMVVRKLIDLVGKRKKDVDIKPQHIKDNMMVFVRATVVNPSFDSQTKETLVTPSSKFGCKPDVSDKFIEKLYKTGIVEKAIQVSQALDSKSLKKTDGKKRSVIRNLTKLEDANWAGTAKSKECTLILTEGDSAMTMAMSGIDEVGRDRFGVFPLKGKLLNVKDCNIKRIIENEEISNLKKIIGLESDKKYNDVAGLRYGRIMALTDSDVDGSHIKGLLFNLFQTLWPSLFRMDGFLTSMLTPIVKAKKGGNTVEFYNLSDYDAWRGVHGKEHGWHIKYYKGLGTSNADEARDYFKKLKIVSYKYTDDETNTTERSMELAFNKKMADERKAWLSHYDKNDVISYDARASVPFEEFVNKELIHFSTYDVKRSIPSICDGLKVSQRKIMFSCFKKKWAKECRVAQLSAFVSETSAYHHGEESLNHAIVGLAQDFVGSNNINLLQPNGQFGSRIKGGKDSSSPRYIYTELSPMTRSIYRKADDHILTYLDDDGMLVEPEFYVPIIPMVLVNGALGIGTGFSTSIPSFNPMDIIGCLKSMLRGEATDITFDIKPWYRGFTGEITKRNDKWFSRGVFEKMSDTKIRITELPVGTWTEEFKEMLEQMLDIATAPLKNYESHYNDVKADFVLHFPTKADVDRLMVPEANGFLKLENDFKLVSTKALGVTNMYMFDRRGAVKKYHSMAEVFKEFYELRMEYYERRKAYQLSELETEKRYLEAKIVFINEIIEGTLVVSNVSKRDVEQQLSEKSYPKHDDSYDYLVGMPIYNLTLEKKAKLQGELEQTLAQLHKLEASAPRNLWMEELEEFEKQYINYHDAHAKAFMAKASTAKKSIRKK